VIRKLLFLELIFFLAAIATFGQGTVVEKTFISATGKPVPGAYMTVCAQGATGVPCSPTVNVYSDLGLTQSLGNTVQADALGNVRFYIAAGTYAYSVIGNGITNTGPFPFTAPCTVGGSCAGGTEFPVTVLPTSATAQLTTSPNANFSYYMLLGPAVTVSVIGPPTNGNVLRLDLQQPSGGGVTATFPANFFFPAGWALNLSANVHNRMAWVYDGTNWQPFQDFGSGTGGSSFYQTMQANGSALPQRGISNCIPPLSCVDNPGNLRTDLSAPSFVGAGGSHAAGGVPDPGAVAHNYPLCDTGTFASSCQGGVSEIANPLNAANLSNTAFPWQINGDMEFKGPTPYLDVRTYGVRSVNPQTTPAAVGLTATCTGTSNLLPISAASTFQNGDGVVVYKCGAAPTITTPTGVAVTPSVAVAGIQTGYVGNAPAGSTTYNYQVIAVDKAGGYTAASSVASTTTGAATLGYNNATITGCTRSNDVVTCTVSGGHGFNPGCSVGTCGQVWISGLTDANTLQSSFNGWWAVASAADSTHFTWQGNADTRLGAATTSAGSGTARWWNCNHITWTAVPNAWLYYIYGRTGGSLTLLAVSKPQGAVGTYPVTDTTWDDFGAAMVNSPIVLPAYIPTTPPGGAGNDYLSTTITSGAGTTTLTLANAAVNSIGGTTILRI